MVAEALGLEGKRRAASCWLQAAGCKLQALIGDHFRYSATAGVKMWA